MLLFIKAYFQENPFFFPLYFLVLHVPLWNRHNERRLLRFGFDIPENLGNFQLQVKNKATVDAPWVCYIHTHYLLIAIGVSVHQWNYRCSGLLYRIGVGLLRCSLRLARRFLGPRDVERATVQGFTSFLCLFETDC